MNTELIITSAAVVVLASLLLYYSAPFLSSLWIQVAARRKGRRMGYYQKDVILSQVNSSYSEQQSNQQGTQKTSEKTSGFSKERMDQIQAMATTIITNELKSIKDKYKPRADRMGEKLVEVEEAKKATLASMTKSSMAGSAVTKGKNMFERSAMDSGFLLTTFLIYMVIGLLVLDTIVSKAWVEQIGLFNKDQFVFSEGTIKTSSFLKPFNISLNALIGFMMNSVLLIIAHIMFANVTLPGFVKKFWFKVILGILLFGGVIVLRFILPDSTQQVKDLMLTFIWLLLFISAFLILHYAFKQLDRPRSAIFNLLFFFVIPCSLIAMATGGIINVLLTIAEWIVGAGYEIRKARIRQVKSNTEEKILNLQEGFQEGVRGVELP